MCKCTYTECGHFVCTCRHMRVGSVIMSLALRHLPSIYVHTTCPHVYTDPPVAGGAHPIEGQVGQEVCIMHTASEGCSHECCPAGGR